ncbi:MAG: hypothetical protein HKN49_11740 [Gammaproteobacteria bacterium]|nr:hypothetical protein [Gammaproteobacteria bacterium]
MSTTKMLTAVLARYFGGDNCGFDEYDFIHKYGRASWALLLAKLFLPDFAEIEGSVLLTTNAASREATDRFLQAAKEATLTRRELEESFNLLEIGYLFDAEGRDTEDEDDDILAEYVGEAWRRSLAASFPGRRFNVRVLCTEETGSTVGVTFSEVR